MFIVSCREEDDTKRFLSEGNMTSFYSESQSYVIVRADNSLLWQSNKFETCYVKIPNGNSPNWFDIVLTADTNIMHVSAKAIDKYLFIHAENPLTKSFTYDSIVTITNNLKIIYYEGKKVIDNRPEYKKYLTASAGTLVITHNDGKYMSGNYRGVVKGITDAKQYNIDVVFNKIPMSLVK